MKQALILNPDRTQLAWQTCALLQRGFGVINASSLDEAMRYARLGDLDLLVMSETIRGQLTHPLALLSEQRNPDAVTILLSDRIDDDVDELFALLPSLTTVLGLGVSVEMFETLVDCELSYASDRQSTPDLQSDWMNMPMGAALMAASQRTGVMPSSQIAQYSGAWPKSPFGVANLERGLLMGALKSSTQMVA